MKSSWIIQAGPKANAKCPQRRHKRKRHVKTEAETTVMQPQAKNTWSHQRLEEARKDARLGPSEGVQPSDTLILEAGLLASGTVKE